MQKVAVTLLRTGEAKWDLGSTAEEVAVLPAAGFQDRRLQP